MGALRYDSTIECQHIRIGRPVILYGLLLVRARQLEGDRLHHRRCVALDHEALDRRSRDVYVAPRFARLLPGVSDLHGTEPAVRLAVVGVDAEIEEATYT